MNLKNAYTQYQVQTKHQPPEPEDKFADPVDYRKCQPLYIPWSLIAR